MKIMNDKITVSVFMMTYNHEKYIAQALDSVLMQQVDFKYEIVLGEDCSTDKTRNIVVEYSERYPGKFKLILHKSNVGAINNQNEVFSNCTGKYIAILEGDDYWTDPLKLQKQVDFLENNVDFGLVCTNYFSKEIEIIQSADSVITLKDILKDSSIGTLTVLYKRNLLIEYNSRNVNLSMGDFPMWIYLCKKAKIYKLADYTAYYRILDDSATGRNNFLKAKQFSLDVISIIKENLHLAKSKNDFDEILRERYGQLFKILIDSKDKEFIKYQKEFFKLVHNSKSLDFKIFLKGFLNVYLKRD